MLNNRAIFKYILLSSQVKRGQGLYICARPFLLFSCLFLSPCNVFYVLWKTSNGHMVYGLCIPSRLVTWFIGSSKDGPLQTFKLPSTYMKLHSSEGYEYTACEKNGRRLFFFTLDVFLPPLSLTLFFTFFFISSSA